MYYFPYRYYHPHLARWTTPDPAGLIDGPNVYGYVGGNPVTFYDKYGDAAVPVIIVIIVVGGEACWLIYQGYNTLCRGEDLDIIIDTRTPGYHADLDDIHCELIGDQQFIDDVSGPYAGCYPKKCKCDTKGAKGDLVILLLMLPLFFKRRRKANQG